MFQNFIFCTTLILHFFSLSAFSQLTQDQLNTEVKKIYQRVNNEAHIICGQKELSKKQIKRKVPFIQEIVVKPLKQSSYTEKTLSREFTLTNLENDSSFDFDVKLFIEQSSGLSKFELNVPEANLSFTGTTAIGGYFTLTAGGVVPSIREVGQEKFNSYSLNNLMCHVLYGRSDEIQLDFNRDYHISVHPHTGYERFNDYGKRLAPLIEPVLEDTNYNHLVLLDHHEYYQFIDLKYYLENGETTITKNWTLAHGLPIGFNQTPEETLFVAPYGDIKYFPTSESQTTQFPKFLYTGGFHNYCMTFNLIELAKLFLLTDTQNDLDVTFKTSAIILQRRGYQKSISGKQKNKDLKSISLKRKHLKNSQQLNDFIRNFSSDGTKYLNNHLYIIATELKSLRKTFKTLVIQYDYQGQFTNKLTIQGTGQKSKVINLTYIE